jgi:hypothetical protein
MAKASRMSVPRNATGPERVERNPILILSAARAEALAEARIDAANTDAKMLLMPRPPLES